VNAPTVSVIVPCYNEEATIRLLLEALYSQTYPRTEIEVLVSDGQSTDRTRDVITAFQASHPDLRIRILDNELRTIPSGLNVAIRAAIGEYVVRLDAHSRPYPDYIQRCVQALHEAKGDNVGGVWEIHPGGASWISRSIAVAAAHPLGVGDAHYRVGGQARRVDTVPFGAYRRSLVERIGLYDESLLTNEDYEFNVRVRNSGGIVWLDPMIRCVYFARSNLPALGHQYFRYGFWKGKMLQRNPKSIRWRQLLPPLFVLSLLLLLAASILSPVFAPILLFLVAFYLLVLILAGLSTALSKRDLPLIIGFPLAVATMHLTWGSALLWSLLVR